MYCKINNFYVQTNQLFLIRFSGFITRRLNTLDRILFSEGNSHSSFSDPGNRVKQMCSSGARLFTVKLWHWLLGIHLFHIKQNSTGFLIKLALASELWAYICLFWRLLFVRGFATCCITPRSHFNKAGTLSGLSAGYIFRKSQVYLACSICGIWEI